MKSIIYAGLIIKSLIAEINALATNKQVRTIVQRNSNQIEDTSIYLSSTST